MASGVKVSDECVDRYQELKLKSKYKYVIFCMSKDLKTIDVLKVEEDKCKCYDDFCAELPDDDCRYGVYDLEYELKSGGKRNKLVFVSWCPDDGAPIKSKMVYSSSKDNLIKKLVGIHHVCQACDRGDLNEEELVDRVSKGGTA